MTPIISQSRHPLNFFPVARASPCRSPSGRLRDLLRVSCRKMSSEPPSPFPTVRTVTIPYPELKDKNRDLSRKIERGLGPDGLGIISISNVPGFSLLRQNLLQLSPRLASLPEDAKEEIQDPDSRYNIGWSHGKEKLESGKPDIFKGSFYANPVLDIPTADVGLIERYSACRPYIIIGNESITCIHKDFFSFDCVQLHYSYMVTWVHSFRSFHAHNKNKRLRGLIPVVATHRTIWRIKNLCMAIFFYCHNVVRR